MLDQTKIMQFADGTLDPAEQEQVRLEIDSSPEYQKILKDYMYTADVLAELGNEIRSLELPNDLKNKIYAFNKIEQSKIKVNKSFFGFANIFNIKYSAIAAAFALFFTGGFYTNQMITQYDQIPSMQTVTDSRSIQLRGSSAEFVTSFYNWFDEKTFIKNVNEKIKNLKEGDKFSTDLVDLNQNTVNFIIDKEFKNKEGDLCKIINYEKKVTLNQSNKTYFISLAVCNENNKWNLIAITLN